MSKTASNEKLLLTAKHAFFSFASLSVCFSVVSLLSIVDSDLFSSVSEISNVLWLKTGRFVLTSTRAAALACLSSVSSSHSTWGVGGGRRRGGVCLGVME